MQPNIIEIDGKHYLELPCLPGDEVYRAGPYFGNLDSNGNIICSFKIYTNRYINVREIIRDLDDFGTRQFLTLEEAEAYKRRLEDERKEEHE